MTPTDEIVAKAEEKIDKDSKDVKEEDSDVKQEPQQDKKVEDKTTDSGQKDDSKEEKVDESTTEEEAEGYTADQLEEEPDEPESKDKPEPAVPRNNLSAEQQFIYEQLPEIVTYDKDGKEYRVKTDAELPKGFEFADQLTQTAFLRNLNAQELNARDLQRQYQEQETTKSSEDFEKRENLSIKQDIADLQKAGELPKFKTEPGDPNFAKDKATEEAQKVLDFMNERNEQYFKEYQQGRAYRHIGFKEAFALYKKNNPGEIKSRSEYQEDKERKAVAKDMGSNVGLKVSEMAKPVVKSGTTTRDILNRIDNM